MVVNMTRHIKKSASAPSIVYPLTFEEIPLKIYLKRLNKKTLRLSKLFLNISL